MPKKTEIDHYSDKEALDFHIKGKSGKIEINSSKPLTTKRDLSLHILLVLLHQLKKSLKILIWLTTILVKVI